MTCDKMVQNLKPPLQSLTNFLSCTKDILSKNNNNGNDWKNCHAEEIQVDLFAYWVNDKVLACISNLFY